MSIFCPISYENCQFSSYQKLRVRTHYHRHYSSSLLLNLLKQTPNISSLIIPSHVLIPSLTNDKLCYYLKKMIKKLKIFRYHSSLPRNFYKINKFWQTFLNIEQLYCDIDGMDSVVFFLKQLPKLSRIDLPASEILRDFNEICLNEQAHKLGISVILHFSDSDRDPSQMIIWIIR